MKDRNSILNLASHARQFKCSITKHLQLSTQTRTLLNTANKEANPAELCRHRLQTLCWQWASP